jgi:hexosaminidase
LDLKGAAPKPEYLFDLLPFFANLHFNAILIEYEDMFPYWDEISILARKNAYNSSIISQICKVPSTLMKEFFHFLPPVFVGG